MNWEDIKNINHTPDFDPLKCKIENGILSKAFATDEPEKALRVDYRVENWQCTGVRQYYVKII